MSNSDLGILAMFAGLGLMVYVTIAIIIYALFVIALWKMFNKMGEAGWKSIIPIYNLYILAKHTWSVKLFWATIIINFAANIIAAAIGQNVGALIIIIAATIALIVLDIKFCAAVSRAFGFGAGMAVLLFFIPNLAYLIIGLGSAHYIGKQSE